jgi:curved DNA-binding protein CbpA
MASQLKDYYRALEVSPTSTIEEIKKAYRRLAFRYHPDTNPDSKYSTARFNEIQEAYVVLSSKEKRRRYDEERWLAGMGNRSKEQANITPDWILREAQKLNKHMAVIDTYRMSHSALHQYILLLLSNEHLAILEKESTKEINKQIVQTLLTATSKLKYIYMADVANVLKAIPGIDGELLKETDEQVRLSKKLEKNSNMFPLLLVAIAVVLVIIMYFWSKR